jgi:hypothetical protein
MSYQQMPVFKQDLVERGSTSKVWYFFWKSLWSGTPPGPESKITIGSSPFTFQAPSRGFVIVQGGTVSTVQFNRSGQNWTYGMTAGPFPVSQSDLLTVTYTVIPSNMVFVPQ